MTEHTPGPWKWVRNVKGTITLVSMSESWGPLTEMIMTHPNYTPELQEANARLMAAAPDLLAALKGLTVLDTISEGPQEGAVVIGPQGWANARDAIALAEEDK